jgi:hypothetical protein
MKKYNLIAAVVLAAGLTLGAPVRAQSSLSAPITVRSSSSKASDSSAKGNWLKAEIIHADLHSMVVREQDNGMMIHTFTYTPDVQALMQKVVEQGGYQYGDKVQILYQQGQTVALRVRGKPSKSL